MLHVSVVDTGVGVAPDKRDAIFEAFTQADSSATRRHGGTGLGLSISQRLAQLMDGGVRLVPTEAGSHFEFWTRVSPIAGAPVADVQGLARCRVLVADDNAAYLDACVRLLRHWGAQPTAVTSAGDVVQAVRDAQAARRPFDAIVLDGELSDGPGPETVRRLREDCACAAPLVVLLSTAGGPAALARWLELRVAACLLKPAAPHDLGAALVAAVSPGRLAQRGDGPVLDSPAPASRLRVLLVEDNPVNRLVAEGLLTRRGHTVTVAHDGPDALSWLARHRADVVLMDVQMPTMSGLQATAAIRALPAPAGVVPIIGVTAHAMQGDRERCLAAGMDAFLSKPLRADELFDALERVVGAARTLQPFTV